MPTYVIDAFEKRDITTVGIPGVFFQTKMHKGEDNVHIILDGPMAKLLAKIVPETYLKYVHQRQG